MIGHLSFARVVLLLAAAALSMLPDRASGAAPASSPKAVKAATQSLAQCVGKLEAQGGGWCELAGASISDVFPTQLSESQRGFTGPASVITAWNGAAWDGRRRKWFFHGGGHSDYGGNEVYEFDLDSATFSRLTDPAPIPVKTTQLPCPAPEHGPRAQHTYDGFFHSSTTDTLWMLPTATGYCHGGQVSMGGEVWEFNPDARQARNGIAPLAWRRHSREMPSALRASFLRTIEMADGSIVVWSNHRGAVFEPRSGEWKLLGARADWGDGNAILDASRKTIWESSLAFLRVPLAGGEPSKVADRVFGVEVGAGIDVDDAGVVYLWSGTSNVVRFMPDTGRWSVSMQPQGPRNGGPVYSKWMFLSKEKVFLAYANPTSGVWVYKPTSDGWREVSTRVAQSYVDAAPNGAEVRIPPGVYARGIRIDKDLTVYLNGVIFARAVDGKANVLVENPTRTVKVTIVGYDMPGANVGTNGAAIRAEYDFDLTVRSFRIRESNMGILTGNRGGRLVLEDGVIEEACCGSDLSHGVYMGYGNELVMRRVVVTNLQGLGHLVKSRAMRTTVEDSQLIGAGGRYSREFEAPNGGIVVLRRNTIQKGVDSDNAESIAIGVEASIGSKPGRTLHPTRFEFTQNVLIFDRNAVSSESGQSGGPNQFGKWRHLPSGTVIMVSDNTFVNMQSWGEFPDLSSTNRSYSSRAAAGLTNTPGAISSRR